MCPSLRALTAGGLLLLCAAAPATAQTRAETIAQQQAEKAATARPYEPNAAEQILGQFSEGRFLVFGVPRGPYPLFGSVDFGSGFGLGGGYRRYVGYESFLDVHGMVSFSGYKRLEVSAGSPNLAGGKADIGVRAGWLDGTQYPYYGLGGDSSLDGRSNYRLKQVYVDAGALWRPVKWIHLRGGVGYENVDEQDGTGASPSTFDKYDSTTAPLLGSDPAYVQAAVSASIFWLDNPGYSRRGGLYRYTAEHYTRVRGDGANFGLVRGDFVQHLPLLRETWVLSLRARTESIVGDTDAVPYFKLPWLGSGSTLRGYGTGRFRDQHSLLFSGEWRWIPNRSALDVAIFIDAGQVAPNFRDLDLGRLHTDYGIGVRFHGVATTPLRIDLARGSEGWRFVFATSAPF